MISFEERCLRLKTAQLNEELSARVREQTKQVQLRQLNMTPEHALAHWSSTDTMLSKMFVEEIYKVFAFGLTTSTLILPRQDSVRLWQPYLNSDGKDMVSWISITGVALFPEWRIHRIEGMITAILKSNKWNVRSLKISFTEDGGYLIVKWEIDLPEEGKDEKTTEVPNTSPETRDENVQG